MGFIDFTVQTAEGAGRFYKAATLFSLLNAGTLKARLQGSLQRLVKQLRQLRKSHDLDLNMRFTYISDTYPAPALLRQVLPAIGSCPDVQIVLQKPRAPLSP